MAEAGGLYLVAGRPELGDWKPQYQVWYSSAEGRWLCSCGRRSCTHIAAVQLYIAYRRALDSGLYIAEAEVECPGRLEADGLLYARPTPRGYRILVISRRRLIRVRCGGHLLLELYGERVPAAAAEDAARRYGGQR
ncbi:hypothetical protein [Pyrobaculum neutrophilum]|uniref:Zinc finger, SWIM domain protein n=1 Tax=Pyrobaculum neutrophilum (strain DSM 2338 / JCM 9278 / NBRC 100436 / V24Sta) TaxID=444157 RepID=B1YDV7_PYRNV|nr:hypothetical protein [Pyrobaculum neutrophilum]ACB39970.1 zinc finger, SWIM domain protein [Pyrobaculum neutrophilum V24Sta]